ncbi:MAG: type II toxin-antitoxin system RelE/ParE family toxin, partial [Verrucomicrobiota bacterium]|nr:type II toxin-antitoxin system RelE/ParE family toxin [Verrucomicrobiota bacterium]
FDRPDFGKLCISSMREIIFYETDFGDKPAEEFLADLEPAARAKVVRSLEMLRTIPIVPAKFWSKLSDQKLWEVRAEYAGNIYRILATTAKGNRVILLHGFQKKSQKTPRQDMEIAQQRQKRYFQRHGYL